MVKERDRKLEQLKSYLSTQGELGNILLLGSGRRMTLLARYLRHGLHAGSVSLTAQSNVEKLGEMAEKQCVDTILFDSGWAKTVRRITDIRVCYLIGLLYDQEDCFGLWEGYRERAAHICLIREQNRKQRDTVRYESLIWDRQDSPVELSVIVPVYNVRQYLGRCLESLTAWRAPYVEYLIVDDGSTDGSLAVIEEYAKKDGRIRCVRKENGGCASARNRGLREALGNYVGFVDGDDFVDRDMFPKLLSRAMMGNYELAYCGYQTYDERTGKAVRAADDFMEEPFLSGTYRKEQVQRLMIRTRVAIWRCIYRRDFLLKNKIWFHEELPRFDDLPFKIESGFCAGSAVCVPEYLYYYRLGRDGQDVACRDNRLFVHFAIFRILDRAVLARKDRRLIDYLQIVKLHTHGYALARIDRKYYVKYLRMARRQLDETATTMRTLLLMFLYGGRRNVGWYLKSGMGRQSTGSGLRSGPEEKKKGSGEQGSSTI